VEISEIIQNYENKINYFEEKNKALEAALDLANKRCEQFSQAYDALTHQLRELLRHRFGKKSERFIDPEHPQQDLFQDLKKTFSDAEAEGNAIEEGTTIPEPKRKKSKTKKELPRRVVIIPLTEEAKKCACGKDKKIIRYETKEMLHYVPAIFEIIEQRREIAACADGCDGEIVTAPAPLHVLPKIKATEEFLAFLPVSKLDDRQPLYHLEKQLSARHGLDCSRQTMARWLIDLMTPMQPIYNLLKDEIIEHDLSSCDATTLQVLKEPGRNPETKSYVYCMRGGPPDKSVILYDYNNALHKQFVQDWYEGFSGYLQVDGDNFFDYVAGKTTLVNCMAHARRKFEPIVQSGKGKGVAKTAMHFFKRLYQVEREAKNNNLTADQRYQLRQEKSKPILNEFGPWLNEMYPTTLPQSPLGKAIYYCTVRWTDLTRYLDDGRLEIDNNLTEQEIKPFVIARKNFLFADSMDGARALCMHMGFIRTAKKHGLDPYHYYVKLLKSLPHCKSAEDYEKLLPWNIQMDDAIPA
jgi:transposase